MIHCAPEGSYGEREKRRRGEEEKRRRGEEEKRRRGEEDEDSEERMATATDPREVSDRLRRQFASGRTRPERWRRAQLDGLRRFLVEREAELAAALRADLGKCALEAWAGEVGFTLREVDFARRRLRRWIRPERVPTPLLDQPGRSRIVREPLGVVLIIGPWNYPVQLLLSPLAGAIAAGNCAVLKPSELAPRSSAALAELLPRYLDPGCIAVVEGGAAETAALLRERFDHIFYTGGEGAGRLVLEAAARHLTPVTLELGGKCPAIVERDADIPIAARRIAWGKFLNAGQTCVAPDHVLVHASREDELLQALAASVRGFYGDDPRRSPDYARIVNRRHHERVSRFLGEGAVVVGGESDPGSLYIAPTILTRVPPGARVLEEEVFGPVLPVLPFASLDEAIARVNAEPKPLAIYLFAGSRAARARVIDETSSGAVSVNEVVNHLTVPGLPFGGVGASGMGAYHGRHSFETFSHRKSVLTRSARPDLEIRYPPYDARKLRWLRRLFVF
jgi:aldehyde dehydrogenase (NAD+)